MHDQIAFVPTARLQAIRAFAELLPASGPGLGDKRLTAGSKLCFGVFCEECSREAGH